MEVAPDGELWWHPHQPDQTALLESWIELGEKSFRLSCFACTHCLILHTLYYSNEFHEANRRGKSAEAKFSSKEMDLAKRLVDTLASAFRPEKYEDEYRKNVERLIAQKRKGKKMTEVEQPKVAPVRRYYGRAAPQSRAKAHDESRQTRGHAQEGGRQARAYRRLKRRLAC
jgi:non-homologous end joining protein Ku